MGNPVKRRCGTRYAHCRHMTELTHTQRGMEPIPLVHPSEKDDSRPVGRRVRRRWVHPPVSSHGRVSDTAVTQKIPRARGPVYAEPATVDDLPMRSRWGLAVAGLACVAALLGAWAATDGTVPDAMRPHMTYSFESPAPARAYDFSAPTVSLGAAVPAIGDASDSAPQAIDKGEESRTPTASTERPSGSKAESNAPRPNAASTTSSQSATESRPARQGSDESALSSEAEGAKNDAHAAGPTPVDGTAASTSEGNSTEAAPSGDGDSEPPSSEAARSSGGDEPSARALDEMKNRLENELGLE